VSKRGTVFTASGGRVGNWEDSRDTFCSSGREIIKVLAYVVE